MIIDVRTHYKNQSGVGEKGNASLKVNGRKKKMMAELLLFLAKECTTKFKTAYKGL